MDEISTGIARRRAAGASTPEIDRHVKLAAQGTRTWHEYPRRVSSASATHDRRLQRMLSGSGNGVGPGDTLRGEIEPSPARCAQATVPLRAAPRLCRLGNPLRTPNFSGLDVSGGLSVVAPCLISSVSAGEALW